MISTLTREFDRLCKVHKNLSEAYNAEFLSTLADQATDKNGRYTRVRHDLLSKGDIVLLKDPMLKPAQFPLARVLETTKNSIGEVTDIVVKKGGTGEIVRRHVTSVIKYLSVNGEEESSFVPVEEVSNNRRGPSRKCSSRYKK